MVYEIFKKNWFPKQYSKLYFYVTNLWFDGEIINDVKNNKQNENGRFFYYIDAEIWNDS